MEPKTNDQTDSGRAHKYPTRFSERVEAELEGNETVSAIASKTVDDVVLDTQVETTDELPIQPSTVVEINNQMVLQKPVKRPRQKRTSQMSQNYLFLID